MKRWCIAVAAALVVLSGCGGGTVVASDPGTDGRLDRLDEQRRLDGLDETPTARAVPQYLTRTYRAPVNNGRAARAGTLRIPGLRISAPVDAVGLDHGAMAIPDRPARVGWLRTTARVGDRIGASVLSGHVSDRRDRPGALSRLARIRPGAVIRWTGARGDRHEFVVTGLRRYPRSRGVPARLFRVTGSHVLHLITCAERVRTASGGFHYTANLVVTARERAPSH